MDNINLLITLSAFLSLSSAFLIYLKNPKDRLLSAFLILIFNSSIWALFMVLYRASLLKADLFVLANAMHMAAIFIPVSFLNLVRKIPKLPNKKLLNFYYRLFFALALVFVLLVFAQGGKNMIIDSVYRVFDSAEPRIVFNDFWFFLYSLLLILPFCAGFFYVYKFYKSKAKAKDRVFLFFTTGAILLAAGISFITNLILPYFGYFELNWAGQLSAGIVPLFVIYGIIRHKIFNLELFVAELFVLFLLLDSLFFLLKSDDVKSLVVSAINLVLVFLLGIWLLKNIEEEHETNKELQKSVNELKKLNEHIKETSKKKSEFLSIATHQLRAPLAVMRGQLSLILEGAYGKLPKELELALKKIYNSSNRMSATIDEFLDVSRIEQGKLSYKFRDIDLLELLRSIYDELKNSAQENSLQFEIKTDKGIDKALVYADKNKIRHVIFNIIDNAIKYTKSGFVRIYLKDKGNYYRVVVQDSGAGIEKDELKTLFSKFVRSKNVYGVNVSGAGLGLYIAREIIHAHNGRIWAESDGIGKGAKFTIELLKIK